jgi:tetratricopeptide (TPR) repeat protein
MAPRKSINIRVFRTILVLVAFFALSLPSLGALAQTAEQNTANRYMQAGEVSLKTRDYRSAAEAFEQALRYNDSENAHLGLGIAYFHLREDRLSERELTRAVELNPRQPAAYQVLGELAYRRDDLETAASHWQKAVELDPANAAVKARLERIQREHRTEKDFNRDVTSHFRSSTRRRRSRREGLFCI